MLDSNKSNVDKAVEQVLVDTCGPFGKSEAVCMSLFLITGNNIISVCVTPSVYNSSIKVALAPGPQ